MYELVVIILLHHHLQVGDEVVMEVNKKNNLKYNKNIMEYTELLKGFIWTMVYSFLGIFIMTVSFCVIEKVTHFSVKKEIIEDENIALGTMFAGFFIAVAIIIAAAII